MFHASEKIEAFIGTGMMLEAVFPLLMQHMCAGAQCINRKDQDHSDKSRTAKYVAEKNPFKRSCCE